MFPTMIVRSSYAQSESQGRLGRLTVAIGHSQTIRLPASYSDLVVGAPDIADVHTVGGSSVYVLGKQVGTTNVSVFDSGKRLVGILDVAVTPDIAFIQSRIRAAVPSGAGVRVSSVGERIVLNGHVPDAATAERTVNIASGFSKGSVINALQVARPQQVLLEVRVVEASRNAARELGFKWDLRSRRGDQVQIGGPLVSGSSPFGLVVANLLSNSSINVDVTIQGLEEKGLVRRLASPNLTALSGSTANFLAGGEFPVPVSGSVNESGQAQTSIQFKRFGVMLDFTPTVLDNGTINLRVTPEVSELDYNNAVRNAGILVPSLVVRRASTELVIKSGQSFAIAGLLQENNRTSAEQVPWIGSVPVLGALFKSQAYQKNETELVIIVTPHLAQPSPPGNFPSTPLDATAPPNDLDFFLRGKFELRKEYRNFVESGGGLSGPFGHVLDVHRDGKPGALRVRN